jgi:hypothetical protein
MNKMVEEDDYLKLKIEYNKLRKKYHEVLELYLEKCQEEEEKNEK